MTTKAWFVDTSVILRAIMDGSVATARWFSNVLARNERLVGSQMLEIEVRRILLNYELRTQDTSLQSQVNEYLNKFVLLDLQSQIGMDAAQIRFPLRAADAIQIATALTLSADSVVVVTHDKQMAAAAGALGFSVHDPVTDDPNCAPVASIDSF